MDRDSCVALMHRCTHLSRRRASVARHWRCMRAPRARAAATAARAADRHRSSSARSRDRRRQRRGADAIRARRREAHRAAADEAAERDAAVRRRARKADARAADHRALAAAVRQGKRASRSTTSQVERTILRIAQENKMSPDDFRKALEQARTSRTPSIARTCATRSSCSACASARSTARSQVTDAEVDHYLATRSRRRGGEVEYDLAHILVMRAGAGDARPDRRQAAARRGGAEADQGRRRIRARSRRDSPTRRTRLQGGDLGWRSRRAPAHRVRRGRAQDEAGRRVAACCAVAAGFHIVKLLEKRSRNEPTVVEQTHARHILIRSTR